MIRPPVASQPTRHSIAGKQPNHRINETDALPRTDNLTWQPYPPPRQPPSKSPAVESQAGRHAAKKQRLHNAATSHQEPLPKK